MGFLNFIRDHFWHAFPILLAGALAVAITIERVWSLFMDASMNDVEGFYQRISGFISKSQFGEAVKLCDSYARKPVARIMQAALQRAHLPESVIHDGIQISLQTNSGQLQKRTAYLATVANVATLLGLFGTIAGLIQSFEAVAHADAQQKSALLSAGISTAMNATMLGLGVAIPCMVVYSFLMSRTNVMIQQLDLGAVRSLDILKQRFYSSEQVQSPVSAVPEK